MDAAELLLHKIRYQGDHADNTVVLVVPYACCGTLIGKGGTLIKSLAEATKAGITVSHHRVCYSFNDRLVKITALIPCGVAPPAFGVVLGLPVPDSWPRMFNGVPYCSLDNQHMNGLLINPLMYTRSLFNLEIVQICIMQTYFRLLHKEGARGSVPSNRGWVDSSRNSQMNHCCNL
ncbi:hypothetical protein CFC21_024127 [Triticum aestivum]|uniref:K Homology domain-containing protein n=2 Tax=Triticum aestivum TaxID=4565 RepID=A0A3B6C8J6_WHEAT|nr:uncharacterized protein LOC123045733 [Triticum aestivum]KAF7009613.1 hypothetical protein CFC21_024127 [Triticum aestivum]